MITIHSSNAQNVVHTLSCTTTVQGKFIMRTLTKIASFSSLLYMQTCQFLHEDVGNQATKNRFKLRNFGNCPNLNAIFVIIIANMIADLESKILLLHHFERIDWFIFIVYQKFKSMIENKNLHHAKSSTGNKIHSSILYEHFKFYKPVITINKFWWFTSTNTVVRDWDYRSE